MLKMKNSRWQIGICLMLILFFSCKNEKKTTNDMQGNEITQEVQIEDVASEQTKRVEENLSGELIVLSEEEFEATITDMNNPKGYKYKGYTPCIIDFYADWCGPCHTMTPILVELAKEYKGEVIFYKVNSDKSPNAARVFGVVNLPTFIFLKPNMQPVKVEGAISKDDMKYVIDDLFFKTQTEK